MHHMLTAYALDGGIKVEIINEAWRVGKVHVPSVACPWPLQNVWLGVSVENRACLERIALLGKTPAARRFAIFGPLREDLGDISAYLKNLDWVILRGESGFQDNPCHSEWLENIVRQCQNMGIALPQLHHRRERGI
jgi:protein gp37